MSDRILVTGAAGRLGRHVLDHLAAAGAPVTALTLEPADDLPADRVVVGDARDVELVGKALADVSAVVHLAAIPSPHLGSAEQVFCGNTGATFTVLSQAAQAGVRRAVIASSHCATGLPFAPVFRDPAYLPIDERTPPYAADPYALSKQVDEATAAMMWWRHGLSVVALRFPFLGDARDTLPARLQVLTDDPGQGAADVWSYLDFRDAARACALGLTRPGPGCHTVTLAAPSTLAPYPTEALLDRWFPRVPRRTLFPGRTVPMDLSRAAQLLDFTAEHVFPVEEKELRS
jgi:nucleoside-diphosphate-sugar epimerase